MAEQAGDHKMEDVEAKGKGKAPQAEAMEESAEESSSEESGAEEQVWA
jgi:hypothetical protein